MSKENEMKNNSVNEAASEQKEQFSLNDDRRVKVLSPGAMVAKRFFRNRIAVVGLCILAFMFVFSFIGGILTPYGENQQFYTTEYLNKPYAGAVMNEENREIVSDVNCDEDNKIAPKDSSLILYFSEQNESLWDIAKRYNTRIAGIYEENNLLDDSLAGGSMLLIPTI